MLRAYYSESIEEFLNEDFNSIFGKISVNSDFADELTQKGAWVVQIEVLKHQLKEFEGNIFFEFAVPRMGSRVDAVVIVQGVILVLEFKVGESNYPSNALTQVWDYALDLKNFHKTSQEPWMLPVLISTEAEKVNYELTVKEHSDNLYYPVSSNGDNLSEIIKSTINQSSKIQSSNIWSEGQYSPTPTIIEAAKNLYSKHGVEEIARSDASAKNLKETSVSVSNVIEYAKQNSKKAICFVTGVPGAGKTLVGLDIATKNLDSNTSSSSVFLSGNGPLVLILREALVRDKVAREKAKGKKLTKKTAFGEVKTFIQNVHHFRDDCLKDETKAPVEHVAIFDEAQRAWNKKQTVDFMKRKKGRPDFSFSEPEFLISCLDRHKDWAVIVCLVGGGQEINTGEAGISEWLNALNTTFKDWEIHISERLTDKEYDSGEAINNIANRKHVLFKDDFHLSVSLRSFRAENLSSFVKNVLDLELEKAKADLLKLQSKYPIRLTRDLNLAKAWLRKKARGSERYGIVVSSQAKRLKPLAIDVRHNINPVNWFLDGKDDVRSSFHLEDVATEFDIQGLEVDWSCVVWDGDLRHDNGKWGTFSFKGNKWQNIKKEERKQYLLNAYRVLLTRARQGMIIVVPKGDEKDYSRPSKYYDTTFDYLSSLGLKEI